jgi:DNA repair exonuclease SbcCD nuclease subunit
MKIKVVSDLHLEFSDIDIPNNGCDLLILSGDIIIAQDLYDHPRDGWVENKSYLYFNKKMRTQNAERFRKFFERVSKNFPHVIYVAGNHEFYHGLWYATSDYLRKEISYWSNIYYLDKEVKIINDIPFLGCTLWSDMNKRDPLTLTVLSGMMNDHRVVLNEKKDFARLIAEDMADRHDEHLSWLKETVPKYDSCMVVGHYGPSTLSTHPKFKDDYHVNGGYLSDLSDFILDHPQIKLWTQGHSHKAFEYTIGETKIVCNPRGYEGYEPDTGWDINKIIEL